MTQQQKKSNKIIIIDNYDSFTYNLVHLVKEILKTDVTVKRNDKVEISEVSSFDKIILSPGPGIPSEAGLMPQIIKEYANTKPILGVCLGHQCIGEVFGGKLINMKDVCHGKAIATKVLDTLDVLYQGVPESFVSGRYHSWMVSREDLPECFKITSTDEDNRIMSITHRELPIYGVQYHPESVMTEYGRVIVENFLML